MASHLINKVPRGRGQLVHRPQKVLSNSLQPASAGSNKTSRTPTEIINDEMWQYARLLATWLKQAEGSWPLLAAWAIDNIVRFSQFHKHFISWKWSELSVSAFHSLFRLESRRSIDLRLLHSALWKLRSKSQSVMPNGAASTSSSTLLPNNWLKITSG